MKLLALVFSLVWSPVYADFDANRDPELVIFAIGQFNGVYSRVGDNALIRISFEDTLYLTVNKDGLDGTQIMDVNPADSTITFSAIGDDGMEVQTLQRVSDGIIWTQGDGAQTGLMFVRRLTVPDAMVIACNAYVVDARDAAVQKTGIACK